MNKSGILSGIHKLLSKNVIGGKQMLARYKGFRGELFFENLLREKYPTLEILDGGIIMSKDSNKTSLDNSMYFTVLPIDTNLDDYIEVYQHLVKIGFEEMFIVLYDYNWEDKEVMHFENETISLKVPSFEVLRFDKELSTFTETDNAISNVTGFLTDLPKRGKNAHKIENECEEWLVRELTQFDEKQLLKIYMDRLFFDGFIGFSKNKGKSSDIDLIIKKPSGDYRLIEVKEKDLPRSGKGFGLDVPRINDMNRIQKQSGIEYHLVVRHINNQTERKLVAWKTISISNFIKDVDGDKTIEGGTGMRSSFSSNPTLICNLSKFRNL